MCPLLFLFLSCFVFFFFFKQKTAYEMRISDWSSDVCSSDLEEDTLILGKVRKDFQNVLDQEEALHLPLGVQPQDLLRVRLDHHLVQATVKRGIDADPVPVPIRRVQDRKSTRLNSSH